MSNKSTIIIPAIALCAVLGGAVLGAQFVSADEGERTSLAAKIAAHFGLDQGEVESFFAQEHEEREVQMHARYEEMLAEAVQNGEITEEQKALIIAKREEMESERKTQRSDSDGERPSEEEMEARRVQMQQQHDALEAWAEEHGIDMHYLMMGGHGHGRTWT